MHRSDLRDRPDNGPDLDPDPTRIREINISMGWNLISLFGFGFGSVLSNKKNGSNTEYSIPTRIRPGPNINELII